MNLENPDNTCLNCGTPLQGKYCSNCGQSAQIRRITFIDTLKDFFSSSFALEGPLISTIKMLLVNPGKLFREFTGGRRKAYYKPVAFFVVMTAVYIIVRALINYDPFQGQPPPADAPGEGRNFQLAARFMVKNINNIMFFLALAIGIAQKLFFRKAYLLAEYVAMGFYVAGMYILFGMFVAIGSVYIGFVNPQINFVILVVLLVYSIHSLHLRKSFWSFCKYVLAAIFSVFLYVLLGYGFSFLIVSLQQ